MSTKNVDVRDFLFYLAGMNSEPHLSPEQCRAARAWLDISQDDLAKAANVSLSTVRDFEKGRRVPIANNLTAIRSALEKEGISFVDGEKTCGIAFTAPKKRAPH